MPWIFFVVAAGLLAIALTSTSMAIMVVCMLASLGLTVAAVMLLMADRVGSAARNEALLIDPQELRRMRELAESRRNAAQQAGEAQATGSADPQYPA